MRSSARSFSTVLCGFLGRCLLLLDMPCMRSSMSESEEIVFGFGGCFMRKAICAVMMG